MEPPINQCKIKTIAEKQRVGEREMTHSSSWRSLRFPIFFCSISLHLILGLTVEPTNSKNANKVVSHEASSSGVGLKIFILCLGLLAIVAFSVFLFKVWQKKKREEQHARLLKLFEDDDELEVELGIRD